MSTIVRQQHDLARTDIYRVTALRLQTHVTLGDKMGRNDMTRRFQKGLAVVG
jgi:hypothetical protein